MQDNGLFHVGGHCPNVQESTRWCVNVMQKSTRHIEKTRVGRRRQKIAGHVEFEDFSERH